MITNPESVSMDPSEFVVVQVVMNELEFMEDCEASSLED